MNVWLAVALSALGVLGGAVICLGVVYVLDERAMERREGDG